MKKEAFFNLKGHGQAYSGWFGGKQGKDKTAINL